MGRQRGIWGKSEFNKEIEFIAAVAVLYDCRFCDGTANVKMVLSGVNENHDLIVPSLSMWVILMTEEEQAIALMDKYADLLRLEKAEDKEKEIQNQLRFTRAKLEVLGVMVDKLGFE